MLYLSAEDWARTQTIGITGGSGMMGQVLVRQLVDLGVRSIRILDTKGEGKRAGRIQHPSVNYVSGSILEETDLQHALRNCSTVLHFAGIKHVRRAQREPVTTIQVNSMGTGLVADACRRLGVEKLVYASSGLVYGVPFIRHSARTTRPIRRRSTPQASWPEKPSYPGMRPDSVSLRQSCAMETSTDLNVAPARWLEEPLNRRLRGKTSI